MKNVALLAVGTLAIMTLSCGTRTRIFLATEHREEVVAYLRSNQSRFLSNGLKGIMVMGLTDAQEEFYKARIEYLMSLIKGDDLKQSDFRRLQLEYYDMFPDHSKDYFYWSRDILDRDLMHQLDQRFPGIEFPARMMVDYFAGMVKAMEDTSE
jgi:hypothetical protein